jgi:hypothetical protein
VDRIRWTPTPADTPPDGVTVPATGKGMTKTKKEATR